MSQDSEPIVFGRTRPAERADAPSAAGTPAAQRPRHPWATAARNKKPFAGRTPLCQNDQRHPSARPAEARAEGPPGTPWFMNEAGSIIDQLGRQVATCILSDVEDGWHYGKVVTGQFPQELSRHLSWYDEVVSGQMLSFLDEARAAIDKFQLRLRRSDGSITPVYSLHVMRNGELTFRTAPPATQSRPGA